MGQCHHGLITNLEEVVLEDDEAGTEKADEGACQGAKKAETETCRCGEKGCCDLKKEKRVRQELGWRYSSGLA